jgi:A/G-specific adenine glycosylase
MPWRKNRSPYRVFISEIMLQQTGTARVEARYADFLRSFPGFKALAAASVEEVLGAWKGLGYNRRALALRQSALIISETFGGRLPRDIDSLIALPGVGKATAAAVLVYAYNRPIAFIETNVRRVYLHFFFPEEEGVPDSRIMPLVEETMDRTRPREWFYALMDYGAMLAREMPNPNRRSAHYKKQSAFEGSVRQMRGMVVKALLTLKHASLRRIAEELGTDDDRLTEALQQLLDEGFLSRHDGVYYFR